MRDNNLRDLDSIRPTKYRKRRKKTLIQHPLNVLGCINRIILSTVVRGNENNV